MIQASFIKPAKTTLFNPSPLKISCGPFAMTSKYPFALSISLLWLLIAAAYWLLLGWKLGPPLIELPGSGWAFPVHIFQPALAGAFSILCAGFWGELVWPLVRKGADSTLDLGGPATEHQGRGTLDRLMERFCFSLLLGFIAQGLVVFALGVFQLYPYSLLVVALPLVRPASWRSLANSFLLGKCFWNRPKSMGVNALMAVLFGCGVLVFLAALAPVIESDGLRYHLFTLQEYLKAGGIVKIEANALTNLPFLAQLNALPALWLGGSTGAAAQVVFMSFWWALLAAAYLLAREVQRSLGGTPSEALLLAALAATLPVCVILASWPFIDLSTAAFTVLSLVVLARGLRCENPLGLNYWPLLLGLLAGGAIATKPTALVAGFFTGLMVLAYAAIKRRLFPVLVYGVAVLAIPAPWFLKSTIYHGNPLYPAAYGIFGGPEWDPQTDAFYKNKTKEKGFELSPVNFLASPLDVTARWSSDSSQVPESLTSLKSVPLSWRLFRSTSPGFEDHNPGPAFLALLPLALFGAGLCWRLRHRSLAVILCAHGVLGWFTWYATYQSVRFLIVPLMLGILLGGATLLRLGRVKRLSPLAQASLGLLLLAQLAWPIQYLISTRPGRSAHGMPLYTTLGFQHPETALANNVRLYTVFQSIAFDLQPTEQERVFLLGNYKAFHAKFPIVTADFFDRPLILTWIRQTQTTEELLAYMKTEQRIRYILLDAGELRLYVNQYFKPRFSSEEWERFVQFQTAITANSKAVVYEQAEGISVIDLQNEL